jgi:glycosyltransferase involved in cell wall biosynthesis
MLAWAGVRILLDYRPALRSRTGVGEYAHQMAAALARCLRSGDSLVLFSSSWKDRLLPGVVPGVPVVDARVPVTVLNLAWHRLEWPPIETFAGEIDVVHSMHPLLMPARRAAQVVTIHDLYFLDAPENTAAEIRRDYPSLAGSHARRADAVITVSAYTAGQIRARLSVPDDRVAICPNGAPPWLPVEPSLRPAPAPSPRGHILFMGTIEPRKNVKTLLRAYADLLIRKPDAPPLVLAGGLTPACQPLLNDLARTPLAGRARHVGYVSGHERERLYREAAMVVLPSLDEGFGLPALEAMTIGVPVVVSSRGALPEVVGHAGLIVDPDDVAGLATAMERLLSDQALARKCSAEGIVQSRRFSWSVSASRLIEAYAAAIERRRSRS